MVQTCQAFYYLQQLNLVKKAFCRQPNANHYQSKGNPVNAESIIGPDSIHRHHNKPSTCDKGADGRLKRAGLGFVCAAATGLKAQKYQHKRD